MRSVKIDITREGLRFREENEGGVKSRGEGSQRREPTVDSLYVPGDHYCLLVRGLPRKFKLEVVVVAVVEELEVVVVALWPLHSCECGKNL